MTLCLTVEGSCLRGRKAGGGMGLVKDKGPLREGIWRLLARRSGMAVSV